MGDSPVVYRERLLVIVEEVRTHLSRLAYAAAQLEARFPSPFSAEDYQIILEDPQLLAWADQLIYRFTKAQDTVGGKMFKAFLLAQGEDVDRPFLDILNDLEKINILTLDSWFELRDLRNAISHDYDADEARAILNTILEYRSKLEAVLNAIEATL